MRWWQIKKARIKPENRELLETYGPETIRILLVVPQNVLESDDLRKPLADIRGDALKWLKEQADIQERSETWLFAMEVAITVFVLFDLVISVVGFFHGCSKWR